MYKIIDKHTEELVMASSFLAKVKGKNPKTLEMLTDIYKQDITNFDNVVTMSFYQWFLADDKLDLSDTNSVFQITFDILNKIEDTLNLCPSYWILLILKYKIISFMNFNEEELISSLEELILNQKKEDVKCPYYIVSDILLAHICYSKSMKQKSKEILLNIFENYSQKNNVLNNFFKGFAIEFRNLLLRSDDSDILDLINNIIEKYFN